MNVLSEAHTVTDFVARLLPAMADELEFAMSQSLSNCSSKSTFPCLALLPTKTN